MNFSNLYHIDYWFGQPGAADGQALYFFMLVFLLLIAGGIGIRIAVFYLADRIRQIIFRKFGAYGMTMGVLGIIWLFVRQQNVPFLSMRFWLLCWLLLAVWWLIKILEYIVLRVPAIKKEKAERERVQKYLPN
ncbi:MAG: hypothetical protein COU31_00365 [Candidatus Magasanikbacteria bacterium CG10_big_fil_rev_8_21_14_0_10_40_10]|uniref:Uncharacterized protein n=1 Tax=Candidatus Magasanikbacteria bacterium CG10_big_fil_rev_8_21_14_0_10_40_10 TaxID=1974648 RepID=A0A2M6W566_9BACT|nr:MAG: hypothetical protein COU31_00365 [Candidatus Magasanikbacteria bacterium CG10_big_fil_rev_8_21_14_0_10_40_10]